MDQRSIKLFGLVVLLSCVCLLAPNSYKTYSARIVDGSETRDDGMSFDFGPVDSMTDTERDEINADVEKNIETLRREGKLLPEAATGGTVTFEWPSVKAPGVSDFNIGMIPNFVDQDPAFPNQIIDWNCGIRTYDNVDGNHRGTDIVTSPFPWKRLEDNEAQVVAAASGTIISKSDGNFDHNCVQGPNPVNRLIIMHADGSRAWYLHFKNGSVTKKEVGDTVSEGEYLGIAGSSGNSTVAHVHFEVHDALDQLRDPYQGACNMLNNVSWWAHQEPYRNSRVNKLMTGSAPPEFPPCPQREITNEKLVFQPGDALVPSTYIRDLLAGQTFQFSLLKPDSSVFQSWNFTSPSTFNWSYRFAQWVLPTDAPEGGWVYRVVYNGQTYEHTFFVGQPPNITISGRVKTVSGWPVSNAIVTMASEGVPSLSARTNQFGFYRIDDVVVGRTYSVSASAKALEFLPRTIMFGSELSDMNFTALNDR